MKYIKKLFIITAVFLLGFFGWWVWSATQQQAKTAPKTKVTVAVPPHPVVITKQSGLMPPLSQDSSSEPSIVEARKIIFASLAKNPNAPITITQLAAAGVSKEDIVQGVLNAENARPIEFYGKVIDQYGSPVVGAKIRGSVLFNVGIEGSGSKDYYTETDVQGLFQFTGLHGVSLGVGPQKDGYEYNFRLPTGWSKDYEPDSKNPVIFTMWKLKGAEPMVHSKIHDYIPCDGTEVHYDLLTSKKVATGGDLVVKLTRNPVNIDRGKPFDWQISVQVSGGGMAEIHDAYPYLAPAEGYSPTTMIAHNSSDKDWAAVWETSYYIKARYGKIYCRAHIRMGANYQPPPTAFDVDIYANPSGSRNLEFDPTKQIKP